MAHIPGILALQLFGTVGRSVARTGSKEPTENVQTRTPGGFVRSKFARGLPKIDAFRSPAALLNALRASAAKQVTLAG